MIYPSTSKKMSPELVGLTCIIASANRSFKTAEFMEKEMLTLSRKPLALRKGKFASSVLIRQHLPWENNFVTSLLCSLAIGGIMHLLIDSPTKLICFSK
jgi:hypothetical protein